MKVVVDIPEEHLKTLRQLSGLGYYHEVIAKGQPLSDVLDKISVEIKEHAERCWVDGDIFVTEFLEIIEKYKEAGVNEKHHCSLWSEECKQCSACNHPCPDNDECLDFC